MEDMKIAFEKAKEAVANIDFLCAFVMPSMSELMVVSNRCAKRMRQVPRWKLLGIGCSCMHAMSCRLIICTQRLSMLNMCRREICSEEGVIRMYEMHCR